MAWAGLPLGEKPRAWAAGRWPTPVGGSGRVAHAPHDEQHLPRAVRGGELLRALVALAGRPADGEGIALDLVDALDRLARGGALLVGNVDRLRVLGRVQHEGRADLARGVLVALDHHLHLPDLGEQ